MVVAHLRMFFLRNHIKAGKPTMDLAGNQSSLANLSSSKSHQAGNYVIFWAQISHETLVEGQHPPSSIALPESPHSHPGLLSGPTPGLTSSRGLAPARVEAQSLSPQVESGHGERHFRGLTHNIQSRKHYSVFLSCQKVSFLVYFSVAVMEHCLKPA